MTLDNNIIQAALDKTTISSNPTVNDEQMDALFYKPTCDTDIIAPFGPTIGYLKLSSSFVDSINAYVSKDLPDFSGDVVGKVNQELRWTDEMSHLLLNEIKNFTFKYVDSSLQRGSYNTIRLDLSQMNYKLDVQSAWFVRQYETEYNPIHVHNGMYSCVGYLKLPEGIEKEWEEEARSNKTSTHGHIAFYHNYGQNGDFIIRPSVGDFYIFPANLSHCVYPFYTKGERRSFSANLTFLPQPKE